jgi:hypothetical protein
MRYERGVKTSSQELEEQADALLAAAPRSREHPAYSEKELRRKGARCEALEPDLSWDPDEWFDALELRRIARADLDTVIEECGLAPAEAKVLRLWAKGNSTREIAAAGESSHMTVHRALKAACYRCSGARLVIMRRRVDREIWECYLEDVRRRLYRKPGRAAGGLTPQAHRLLR